MDGISVPRKEAQGACLSLTLYEEDTEKRLSPERDPTGTWIRPKLRTGQKKQCLFFISHPVYAMCLFYILTAALTDMDYYPINVSPERNEVDPRPEDKK